MSSRLWPDIARGKAATAKPITRIPGPAWIQVDGPLLPSLRCLMTLCTGSLESDHASTMCKAAPTMTPPHIATSHGRRAAATRAAIRLCLNGMLTTIGYDVRS